MVLNVLSKTTKTGRLENKDCFVNDPVYKKLDKLSDIHNEQFFSLFHNPYLEEYLNNKANPLPKDDFGILLNTLKEQIKNKKINKKDYNQILKGTYQPILPYLTEFGKEDFKNIIV